MGLEVCGRHRLEGSLSVREGERRHLEIGFHAPAELDSLEAYDRLDPKELDESLQETLSWWHDWRTCIGEETAPDELRGQFDRRSTHLSHIEAALALADG